MLLLCCTSLLQVKGNETLALVVHENRGVHIFHFVLYMGGCMFFSFPKAPTFEGEMVL